MSYSRGAPKRATCRCGAPLLTVLYRALDLHLDEPALTQLGEVDALVSGGRTFAIFGTNVVRRTASEITLMPAPKFGTVHREHSCGSAVPEALRFKPVESYGDDPGF